MATSKIPAKIAQVASLLEAQYHTPDLGNQQDPLDEIIFIVLTNRVIFQNYAKTWDALKSSFPDWAAVMAAEEGELQEVISIGGLSKQKSKTIKGILQAVQTQFGVLSLNALFNWTNEEILRFLCSIPGIGVKTAKCVMMYSLKREVFPVDTHIRRIFHRLGILPEPLLTSEKIEELVRPDQRYALHVNMVYHGQTVCRARWPQCPTCFLLDFCEFGKASVKRNE